MAHNPDADTRKLHAVPPCRGGVSLTRDVTLLELVALDVSVVGHGLRVLRPDLSHEHGGDEQAERRNPAQPWGAQWPPPCH